MESRLFLLDSDGRRGGFSKAEMETAYTHIWAFLAMYLRKKP